VHSSADAVPSSDRERFMVNNGLIFGEAQARREWEGLLCLGC
jgi:hypothetical protein